MITNETILKEYGGLNANSLSNIMLFTDRENDEPELIQTSNYFDNANLSIEMSTKMHSFNMLSLNCQSINAKIDELKIKIKQWKAINCQFSAICLQETWLSGTADTSLLQIDGYTIIYKGKTCSAHGGLLIYLDDMNLKPY